jgi:uncharacterized protein
MHPAPITESQRIRTLDVVRGFALLGILVPNIVVFAWPSNAMTDPAGMGGGPWNEAGHGITAVFFLGKMMALFSMLFGAGVVVYGRKFDDDGNGKRPPLSRGAGLWYRRTGWLLVFGLVHAVGLWFGDILVWYAMAGLLAVWWVRRINPRWQIVIGLGLHLVGTILITAFFAAGIWAVGSGKMGPEALMGDPALEIKGYTGTYLDAVLIRLPTLAFFWLLMGPMFTPGVTGLMMIGMGLVRLGILTGERPTSFYANAAVLGLVGGLGLTLTVFSGIAQAWPDYAGFIWQACAQFIGIPISLGYMALLIWLVRIDLLRPLTNALASVGRMALSNYLLQTILCTTLFYGYGLGYYAKVEYPALFGVVAGVWIVNIVFSTVWLRFFRFGPAEWLWRSLTYWKPQPMRR